MQDIRDEVVSLVGDDAFRVVIHLLFRCGDDRFGGVLVIGDLLADLLVSLEDFDLVPALFVRRDAAQHGTQAREHAFHILRELRRNRGDAALCGRDHFIGSLVDPGPLEGGDLHDLAAELVAERLDVDTVPVLLDQVHHVEGDHDRDPKFQALRGEIEISLQVRRVHDIEDRVGLFFQKIIPRDHFFQSIG